MPSVAILAAQVIMAAPLPPVDYSSFQDRARASGRLWSEIVSLAMKDGVSPCIEQGTEDLVCAAHLDLFEGGFPPRCLVGDDAWVAQTRANQCLGVRRRYAPWRDRDGRA